MRLSRGAMCCRRCTGCRSGSKIWNPRKDCARPTAVRCSETMSRIRIRRLVAAIRAAGAIVIGKTNTPEFGAGANTRNAVYGATGNPFDPSKSCAGSSGGSAVALATGMVPICQGSDTGGSLRNPAAFCGIVGFRPTPGSGADRSCGRMGGAGCRWSARWDAPWPTRRYC